MSDDTKRILKMVAAGKITADEGERLRGARRRDGERDDTQESD